MLSNILTPAVCSDQSGRTRRQWLLLAAVHSLGNILAAGAVGVLLVTVSWAMSQMGFVLTPAATWLAGLLGIFYLPRTLGWSTFPPLLQSKRQVPRRWAYAYPRSATALLFGLGLGSGCYTRIVVPTFYLLLLSPFLTASLVWPLVVWSTYGFFRSWNVWWIALRAPPEDPLTYAFAATDALMQNSSRMRWANAVLLACVAGWSIVWGLIP